jgi:hypothetical protein
MLGCIKDIGGEMIYKESEWIHPEDKALREKIFTVENNGSIHVGKIKIPYSEIPYDKEVPMEIYEEKKKICLELIKKVINENNNK